MGKKKLCFNKEYNGSGWLTAMNYSSDTEKYISSTQSVLNASKLLRSKLEKRGNEVEFYVNQLEQAVKAQRNSGDVFRSFMFSELESTTESDKSIQERIIEDTFIGILTDLETANLLISAGASCGEAGERIDPSKLDEAIRRLDNTLRTIERSQPFPLSPGYIPGRFGFQEEASGIITIKSPDLPSAITAFRERADATLLSLVSESNSAITNVVKELSRLKPNDVAIALSCLGCQIQELPQIGKLLGLGIKMVQDSIDSITRLLGSDAIDTVKESVKEIWEKIRDGEYLDQLLWSAFEIQKEKEIINDKILSGVSDKNALDIACNELSSLETRFKETMALMKGIISAVTFGSGVIATLPAIGIPNVVLMAPGSYFFIFAVIVLLGIDYADSGRILQLVCGVGEIAKRL
ncbi:MAG: hypothetical protein PHS80_03120 [Methanothrix sp.]|nr:hypothetical protein [Methanothrix sp.]MDD4448817.1 hypothetical protein [Methanothrix sp.]